MKFFLLFSLICIAECLSQNELEEWMKFRAEYNKIFNNASEEVMRLGTWLENKKLIEEHNEKFDNGEVLYQMTINQFTDMPKEERDIYSGLRFDDFKDDVETFANFDQNHIVASSVDYRQKGFVTPVKNQGRCGACYSFSVTGAMEGQHFRRTGRLVSFSEQQIIDCSRGHNSNGCHGGNMNGVYDYIREQGGLDTESSYPYRGVDNEACRYNPRYSGATLSGYKQFGKSENDLMHAVSEFGPISVGIFVANSFYSYHSGIYYEPNCNHQINHAVLVVGYGNERGYDYWLVKNSWGAGWGEKGYVKMLRNRGNLCGIASWATVPLGVSQGVEAENPQKTHSVSKYFMKLILTSGYKI